MCCVRIRHLQPRRTGAGKGPAGVSSIVDDRRQGPTGLCGRMERRGGGRTADADMGVPGGGDGELGQSSDWQTRLGTDERGSRHLWLARR